MGFGGVMSKWWQRVSKASYMVVLGMACEYKSLYNESLEKIEGLRDHSKTLNKKLEEMEEELKTAKNKLKLIGRVICGQKTN